MGKMIEEGCGVGQLVDNCIYLIADPKSEMAKKAVVLNTTIFIPQAV